MHIRPYEPRDEAQVIALWRDQLPGGWQDPADSLRRKLAVNDGLLFVAIDEATGHVIGATLGGYDGHRGWIYSVCVDAAHRRRGVGTLLLRTVEAQLIARGAPKINLQVRATNTQVIAFYESLGYATETHMSMGKRV
jgi:hypothetical protein